MAIHALSLRLALAIVLLCLHAPAKAEQVSCTPNGLGVDTCTITLPNVLAASTEYPEVSFLPGDLVSIAAGGCVQTGGAGQTWKRYVDPIGSNAVPNYQGSISIPGATAGLVSIQSVQAIPQLVGAPGTLKLGYTDDQLDDNGYYSHDAGTDDQCSDQYGFNDGRAWVRLTIFRAALPFASVDGTYGHCRAEGGGIEVCRIDRPDVTRPVEAFPAIRFSPGDKVAVSAGGCAQTGGSGKSWKRYVDPTGDNSDRLYFGEISIPGATNGLVRLTSVVGKALPPSVGGFLMLGYRDDDYGDNGYWSRDDGTDDQCARGGTAFVELTIQRAIASIDREAHIDGVEVVQAIQDLAQTVPLVAGKQTWLRLYASSTAAVGNRTVSATIKVWNSGTNPAATVASITPVLIRPSTGLQSRRLSWPGSLNFLLPVSTTAAGQTQFEIESLKDVATGAALACDQCTLRHTIRFHEAPPLRVRLIGLSYQAGTPAALQAPGNLDYQLTASWLGRAFPTHQADVTWTTVAAEADWPFEASSANEQVSAIRGNDVGNGTDARTHYLGVVSDGGDFMRGLAEAPDEPDPSAVGSTPSGNPAVRFPGDLDASYADWYGGHELAHTFGREHAGYCNNQADPENGPTDASWPYPNGQISDDLGTQTGLDVGDPALLVNRLLLPGNTRFDVMTYCNQPQWVSAHTFAGLLDRLRQENDLKSLEEVRQSEQAGGASTLFGPLVVSSGNFVHVVARIDVRFKTGKISFVTPVGRATGQKNPGKSNAQLRLVDGSGRSISAWPVDLRMQEDGGARSTALVSAMVPFNERMKKIQLIFNDQLLDEFTGSAAVPPAVAKAVISAVPARLAKPLMSFKAALQWSNAKVQGEKLVYIVESSPDGVNWKTKGIGLKHPYLGLREEERRHWFRVSVSNGFRRSVPFVLKP